MSLILLAFSLATRRLLKLQALPSYIVPFKGTKWGKGASQRESEGDRGTERGGERPPFLSLSPNQEDNVVK